YWAEFGRYCVERGLLRNPCLDDALCQQLGSTITDKADRGGGFATPMSFHEVLSCTRKVHWPPQSREPWNGFRTAKTATPCAPYPGGDPRRSPTFPRKADVLSLPPTPGCGLRLLAAHVARLSRCRARAPLPGCLPHHARRGLAARPVVPARTIATRR